MLAVGKISAVDGIRTLDIQQAVTLITKLSSVTYITREGWD
jgi:hypothetical protein